MLFNASDPVWGFIVRDELSGTPWNCHFSLSQKQTAETHCVSPLTTLSLKRRQIASLFKDMNTTIKNKKNKKNIKGIPSTKKSYELLSESRRGELYRRFPSSSLLTCLFRTNSPFGMRSSEGCLDLVHGLHTDGRANCVICFRIKA